MKVAIITDSFPPLKNSGAIQIRDLSIEFVRQGHEVVVITPSSEIINPYLLSEMDKVQVLILKAPKIKDIGYFDTFEYYSDWEYKYRIRKVYTPYYIDIVLSQQIKYDENEDIDYRNNIYFKNNVEVSNIYIRLSCYNMRIYNIVRIFLFFLEHHPTLPQIYYQSPCPTEES